MASGAPRWRMFQCGSPGRSFSATGPRAFAGPAWSLPWPVLPLRPVARAAALHAAAPTARARARDAKDRPPRIARVVRGQPHAIHHEPAPAAASAAGPMRMNRMTVLDHSDTGRETRLPNRAECTGTVHPPDRRPRWCREPVLITRRGCHNPDMLPGATDSADDPLEQDAPDHPADDPAIAWWFLGDGDRANPATDLRTFTIGNLVQPLVDGRSYFSRLHAELNATEPGDQVYFLDFRGDLDELLDGPDSAVGDVLGRAARRGVKVFGLLWRS